MPANEPSAEVKLQVLYDHYKDTCGIVREREQLRGRLFIAILAVVTLMSFRYISPSEIGAAISDYIGRQLQISGIIRIDFIVTAAWYSLLALIVRYYQVQIYIDRQYAYIHQLEPLLSCHFDEKAMTREGKSYLTNYPEFSNYVFYLYTVVFPSILLLITVLELSNELVESTTKVYWFLDLACFSLITASILAYVLRYIPARRKFWKQN